MLIGFGTRPLSAANSDRGWRLLMLLSSGGFKTERHLVSRQQHSRQPASKSMWSVVWMSFKSRPFVRIGKHCISALTLLAALKRISHKNRFV